MESPQPARYFEDIPVGLTFETGTHVMSAASIVAFAEAYDPQPFHLDPKAAKASLFRAHVASGWHTASVTMKLMVESGVFGATGMIGLGVENLRWTQPVFAGDVLYARVEVIERTPSENGRRGVVRNAVTTLNAKNEPVMTMTTAMLVPARPLKS